MAATADSTNDALDFLRELIGAQPDGEEAVQGRIGARLESSGCSLRTLTYDPGEVPVIGEFAADESRAREHRTAVVGTLAGEDGRRSLLLFAHPDAEPVADTGDWRHAPFAGDVDGTRMYGWGVADDLAGCAAAVLAMERAAASGADLGDVVFASTPSKRYARGVAAVLHDGLSADASLYLHPAESGVGMGEIKALASGQLEFLITVEGRLPETTEPGHTAFSHLAVNPVDKAFVVHAALSALADERAARVRHPRLQAAVGRSTNIQVSNIRCGELRSFSRLHARCELGGAVSFPPGETYGEVMVEVEAAIERCARADEWLSTHPPAIRWLTGVTGAEVAEEHPLYRTAAEAVRRVTGEKPFVNAMHTSSDIRNPAVEKGIPTVGLGCYGGDLTQNGRHDEWIDVPDFLRMVDVTTAIVLDWCGTPKP